MNTRRRPSLFAARLAALLPPLAALLLAAVLAWAGPAAAPLQLQVSFDNDYVAAAQPGLRYLEVLVTAPAAAVQPSRVPLNLALVIDTSGSMGEQNKLDYVKQAAAAMLDRLRPEDRFALIAYSTKARVIYPSQPVQSGQQMQWLVNALEASGGTNLGDGLLAGYEQVRNYAGPAVTSRILLLSDGLANIGVTAPEQLAQMVSAQSDAGISLSSFGVGLEFNEDLLAAIAETGRGMYYFIDHPESIGPLLSKEFKSVEQLAAADIRVRIVLSSDLMVDQVFANSFEVSGNAVSIRFGDLPAGERRRMQIRLRPRPRSAGRLDNAAQISVSYALPGSPATLSLAQNIGLNYAADAQSAAAHQNQEVSERAAVFEANQARKDAALAVDKGEQHKADAILSAARAQIQAAAPATAKVQGELNSIEAYGKGIGRAMPAAERSLEQKKVKYRSQAIEGC